VERVQIALTAGFEAIEEIEAAAQRKRDELAKKNYQKRVGLMTGKAGKEWWKGRVIREQSLADVRERKAQKEIEMTEIILEEDREEYGDELDTDGEIDWEYSPYKIALEVQGFNQRVIEAQRASQPPLLQWD
jgi:hypothetical protein